MTVIVTGAAGFIGSNLVHALNRRGETDIVAVDNLTKADKFKNLVDCEIRDYLDKLDFLERLEQGQWKGALRAVFHQGACSDTMGADGRYMMENNYRYSLRLLDYCTLHGIPFIYASSASVYGRGPVFQEDRAYEAPLNVYAYSKFLFDQVVRQRQAGLRSQVVGFRYFNVYGPREQHKERMASVAFHQFHQYRQEGKVKLFEGCDGYGPGAQRRDFIHVDDVVAANLYFWEHPECSGIFNVGTGAAQTFNDVAVAVVNTCRERENLPALSLDEMVQAGILSYVPFPEALKGKYQSFTQADVAALRAAGFEQKMHTVETGVQAYVQSLWEQYPR